MGWNKVIFESEQLLSNYYYFANSYYAPITKDTTGICEYGIEFSATVQKDNFFGCQFHPELKSRVDKAHPLFREFVKASLKNSMN